MRTKIILAFGILLLGSVLVACIPQNSTTTTTNNSTSTTISTTLPAGTTTTTSITTISELDAQLLSLYQLATGSGDFTGTYEEWLESVRGPQGVPGEDGREIFLQVADGVLQWQFEGDLVWTTLFDLSSLKGISGREVLMQVADNAILWQYEGDESWNVLLDLAVLTGSLEFDAYFQVSEGWIQWKTSENETWTNLIELQTLTGDAGQDGKEIYLQVIDGTIQWQHEGDEVWQNLVDIASLTGKDGQEVTFRIYEGYIQWQYIGTSEWIDLIDLASLTGAAGEDGLSAYEIYMKYYPDYTGDEEQWINDLINGRLGTADEAYLLSYYDLGDVNFYALASGGEHALAISVDKELYAWGSNEYGQIGDGTTIDRKVPVNINGNLGLAENESVLSIACGFYNSYIITSEKRLLAWGYNYNGEIGDGTMTEAHLPVDVTPYFTLHTHETIEQIIPGFYHNYVITSEHRVFAWGMDSMDQLGTSDLNNQLSPIDLTSQFALAEGDYIVSISAGGWHTFALSNNGVVYAWGNNEYGQVGTGDTLTVSVPTEITSRFTLNENETITSLVAGSRHSFAITSTGRVFGWGDNSRSQLGMSILGFTVLDPTDISSCFDLHEGEVITDISAMGDYSLGLTSEGRIFSWGNNYFGQLGDGTTRNRSTPGDITYTFNLGESETLVAIAEGHFHSLALSSSGRLYAWGNNDYGQLGDGTLISESLPDDLTVWVSIWRENLYYGSALGYPVTPVRSGFVFMGWYYEPTFETKSVNALMTAGNVDLYARWELLDVYLVEFDTGEGSHTASRQVTENDYLFLPEDEPSLLGYTFAGWYYDSSYVTPVVFPLAVTSNLTVYAKWDINSYSVFFHSNGGSDVATITQDYQTEIFAPENPTKEGYTFEGWYEDESLTILHVFSTIPAYDMTLYALWQINSYTISFESNEGSIVSPMTQFFGTEIIAPEDPTKDGYSFIGWYEDELLTVPYVFSTMPSHDFTVYASWSVNSYNLSFETFEGTSIPMVTQDYGTQLVAPENPTKDGYTFDGWYEDSDCTIPYVFTSMPSYDFTVYAKWTAIIYTISFESNGGSSVESISQAYGTEVSAPSDPTKDGYDFNGWYADSDLTIPYVFSTMPNDNITLYASWTEIIV